MPKIVSAGIMLGATNCPFCHQYRMLRVIHYKNGRRKQIGEACQECIDRYKTWK